MLFDHHIHSKYSTGESTSEIPDILDVARRVGLGGVAISDHNQIRGSLEAVSRYSTHGLVVIPSVEISSSDGHIVGLGLKELVERDLTAEETIEKIHRAGGLAIAAHPYDKFRSGVGDLSWRLEFDAIEINGHCLYGNRKARDMARRHGKPLVGGSDAHALGDIGSVATEVDGNTPGEILQNIQEGRCKAVYRVPPSLLKARVLLDKVQRRYSLRSTARSSGGR